MAMMNASQENRGPCFVLKNFRRFAFAGSSLHAEIQNALPMVFDDRQAGIFQQYWSTMETRYMNPRGNRLYMISVVPPLFVRMTWTPYSSYGKSSIF
ncbi:MAG TPA: hypothetical protein VN371_06650 [Chlorobaculum sp.]|nr:hypothetical protein [Chlorobaculum sp.]